METEMIWGLVRLIVVLLVVIPGAIYATRWYAKRQTLGKDLRIMEALSLGPNKALYLIEWDDQSLLLGVTNQTITLLASKTHEAEEEVGE
ncbi:MAG: flagellar biosynthetic protein FliO [Firmicutes bacterium]|nr:flagellar biosynthetic protein FliO [Bacillota bacterium]